MAGSATVGSLRVIMGMDAADFDAGVKRIEAGMGGMVVKFGAAAAAGTVFANTLIAGFRAIGHQLSGFGEAIKRVGDFVDASQKFGVSAESLMAFGHSADLAGTSIEGLSKGLQKLNVAMTNAATGEGGKAADTLKALGVVSKSTAGNMKSTEDVLIGLADKFADMEDGAAKTAMAVAIFGKSGAELIPLLNQGSKELARQAKEARDLGLVLDNETARGLEAFGDRWETSRKSMLGFWTQLAGQLLPTMNFMLDKIKEWLGTEGGVKSWAKWAADGVKAVVEYAFEAGAAFARLRENVAAAGTAFANFFTGNWSKIAEDNASSAQRMLEIDQGLNDNLARLRDERINADIEGEKRRGDALVTMRAATTHQLTEGEKELNRLLEEKKRLTEELATPNEALIAQLEKIDILQAHTGLSAELAGRAMQQAAWGAANAHAGAASKIMGNLQGVFGKAKGFAIAQAVINTFEAFTAALKGPPGPPWSYAIAASTLAAGFAQVQNIKSTNPGSASGGSSGGASASASAQATAPAVQQQGMYVNLQGSSFGREQVIGLIDQINQAGRDGYKIEVSTSR
jgi:hypothetical protein